MSGATPIAADQALPEKFRHRFRIRSDLVRCALAELVCTALFVWTGTSVSAQTVLSRGRSNEYVALALGWGLSLLFAVQLGSRISGSHLNPAVSLFFYTFGHISSRRLIVYSVVQFVGAFFGALLTFILYHDAISAFDGGERYVTGPLRTAKIFATYPSEHLGAFGGIVDQVLGTAFLSLAIGLVTDRRNRVPSWAQPTLIGFSLVLIGVAFGHNCGYAVNPARDFSPRLFSLMAGYGWKTFSYRSYKWFWIPLLAPFVGGIMGAWLYQFLIGIHIPSEIDELEEEVRRIQVDKAATAVYAPTNHASPPSSYQQQPQHSSLATSAKPPTAHQQMMQQQFRSTPSSSVGSLNRAQQK